ncbi:MAG: tetratricopeptide repeat protein [Prochloron sp. SP5CPC1]|nr:tetratricopeptide repeat protein [Candidatus Paraprochloron terpiosi SP5CPC1]
MRLLELGRYSEAEHLYLEALDITERRLGKEHPHTIIIRNNLKNLLNTSL